MGWRDAPLAPEPVPRPDPVVRPGEERAQRRATSRREQSSEPEAPAGFIPPNPLSDGWTPDMRAQDAETIRAINRVRSLYPPRTEPPQATPLPAAQPEQSRPMLTAPSQTTAPQATAIPPALQPQSAGQIGDNTPHDVRPKWMDAPEADKLSWADVPGKALENAPSSALKLGKAVLHPILHPIDTATSIYGLGYGLASKLHGKLGGNQDPQQKAEDEAVADAIGKHFAKRYGDTEGLKKALAEDPIGVMADAAMVLSGGGAVAARGPGVVARAGRTMQATANAVDPLTNVGRVVGGAGTAAANVLGITTGAGTRPFQEAARAGYGGNEAFRESLRGRRPLADAVDMAEDAVGAMGRERSAAYQAQMAETNASQARILLRPVQNIIRSARDLVYHEGIPKDAAAAKVIDDVTAIYDRFAGLQGRVTPGRVDALKQAIGEIRQRTMQGTLERKVADQIYRGVRDSITAQVPSYADAMRDYARASDEIGEARRTLSVNDRAATDTTLRKLQSTMRDNVNTNWGERGRVLDALAQYRPDLPYILAGQALNSWAPRGLARYTASAGGLAGVATMNPATVAMLPFTSPRLMGEVVYGAGRAAGGTNNALMQIGLGPDALAALARESYAVNALTNAGE